MPTLKHKSKVEQSSQEGELTLLEEKPELIDTETYLEALSNAYWQGQTPSQGLLDVLPESGNARAEVSEILSYLSNMSREQHIAQDSDSSKPQTEQPEDSSEDS